MGKFLITKNYYGTNYAIKKSKIDSIMQNNDEDDDKNLTIITVGKDEYASSETINEILAKLEE